jgi:hypothetical protein
MKSCGVGGFSNESFKKQVERPQDDLDRFLCNTPKRIDNGEATQRIAINRWSWQYERRGGAQLCGNIKKEKTLGK